MNRKLLKYSLIIISGSMILASYPKSALICGTGAMVMAANTDTPVTERVYEEAVAGFSFDKSGSVAKAVTPSPSIHEKLEAVSQDNVNVEDEKENAEDEVPTYTEDVSDNIPIPGFVNIALADVDKDSNLNIHAAPSDHSKLTGKLPYKGACTIVREGNYWAEISSGNVKGYVRKKFLITGQKATQFAKSDGYGDYIATGNTQQDLNVRKSPSVDSDVMDTIAKGEELLIIDPNVITYGKEHDKWVKVSLDSDESSEGAVGYVAKEYVTCSYKLKEALSMFEIKYGADVSMMRVKLITEAQKHIGESYVWGGTVLGKGVDCSGFTQQLYKKVFHITIPRVSRDQARGGTAISRSQLLPGDLVFYGNNGTVSHVAIYIGDGRIIHAASRRSGIKTSEMNYRTPLKYARYINDK